MAPEAKGKGEAHRQPLPSPATTTEMYLAAILGKLDEIQSALGEEPPAPVVEEDEFYGEVPLMPARQSARKGRKR